MSSDQLALLVAFEEHKGLLSLAETMGKDPSVISRGLQRMAEDFPVIVKVKGKWEMTPLGRRLNELTRAFLAEQRALIQTHQVKPATSTIDLRNKTALVIINAQQGLLDATQLGRNNSEAEKNIELLLQHWRSKHLPIIHVKHVSENQSSVFYRQSTGSEFLPSLAPINSEEVIEKYKSSGFLETSLESALIKIEASQLVLVGFTANECIDATARDAAHLGFTVNVVGDATAMFDMKSKDGKLLKAERIHKLTLANIEAFYANVINTDDIIKFL